MSTDENKNCQSGKVHAFSQMGQQATVQKPRFGGDNIRVVEAMIDFIYPAVPFPSNKIFKSFGEENIRRMVAYHHDLLKKTAIGHIFPQDDTMFAMVVQKSADFFVEALGGDEIFTIAHGEPHLRLRHLPFDIDENTREIWLAMYKKTLKDIVFPKENLEEFWNWIEPLSIRMINRRRNMEAPKRHYWSDMKSEFGF